MAALLTKNTLIQVGIQADAKTPAVALTPMRVFDVEFNPFHANRTIERSNAIGKFGMDASLHGGNLASIQFSWNLHAGEANDIPIENPLYEISAMASATANGATTYTPISDPTAMKVAQINMYHGPGKLRIMYGCVCSAMSLTMNAGEAIIVTATFVGFYQSETDAATPSGLSFSVVKPYINKGATIELGGVSGLPVKTMTLDLGFATPDRADITHSSSYAPPIITNRIVKGTITLEQSLIAVNDWREDVLNASELALSYSLVNPALTINLPRVVLETTADGDDEGVMTDDISFMAARLVGDDEFNIIIGGV